MARADETTQVDYSLLDDAALGDAVAKRILGWEHGQAIWLRRQPPGFAWGDDIAEDELVSWWGAGLVIDSLRAEGHQVDMFDLTFLGERCVEVEIDELVDARDTSPIRAILIAALRAREAEA